MTNEVRFYKSTGPYGFLSNLYPCDIKFEGQVFHSAEHAYQYGKANKQVIAEWIKAAPFPRLAAIAGHGLFLYDIVPNWKTVKIDRMLLVIDAKFTQHPKLRELLLATKDAVLIEDSKTDAFWGLGKKGLGQNMLGTMLMTLRDELRKEAPK